MRGILRSKIHPLRGHSSKPGGLTPSRCDKNMIGLAQTLCVILINAIFSEPGENGRVTPPFFNSSLPGANSRPPLPMEADFD